MDCLQTLLDNSTTPALTALLLGLLTAISPCPLATNIAAIGYISKDIENRRRIFRNGVLYTIGRIIAYTILGIVLISILKEGASVFGIQKAIGKWGELLIGPLLLIIGLFMLFGNKLNLPRFGFGGNGESLVRKGGWGALLLGVLFAMAFCPTSGVLYFGMLIPMSVTVSAGWLLPVLFAVATALPVLAVAWILAFSVEKIGEFYGKLRTVQKWLNIFVGVIFIAVLPIKLYNCKNTNMDNKETKKNFWSTLFSPKKKSCCCNGNIIVENDLKLFEPAAKAGEVLVLGPGCAKCKETYMVVEHVISENNLGVKLSIIEDISEMMKYNIMATPAVVVDGIVKIKGHVPTAQEVKKALGI